MKKECGNTMAEFIIASSIVILLASGAFLGLNSYNVASKIHVAETDISNFRMAISKYNAEIGNLPTNLNELSERKNGKGPWLTDINFIDPWGEDYIYVVQEKSYAVWSKGPDRIDDTENGLNVDFSGDDVGILRRR